MEEIFLGPFSPKETSELIALGAGRFNSKDRKFLLNLAGGHPYLLQVASSALWETYEEGRMKSSERWLKSGETLYNQVQATLYDTWGLWSPEYEKGFYHYCPG